MADLIKQLRRAIAHTNESYRKAWDKRQVIRNKEARKQAAKGGPRRTFGVTDSPVLTVDEAKLFLEADNNIKEAHRLYERLSEIPGRLTEKEIGIVKALGRILVTIEDKWARGRAIPTNERSGFRRAPAMRGERGVLEAANSVIEDWEQAQPAQRIGDRPFEIIEGYDPGAHELQAIVANQAQNLGEEDKGDVKGEGTRRHKRRRKRRRTQKKQGKKRRTQRRRKTNRGKTRRRRRKR